MAFAVDQSGGDGGVVETDDVLFTFTSVPVQFFNNAFVKPHADPAACIEVVTAFFHDRGTPFTVRFRRQDRFEPDDALERAGLEPAGSTPLMVAASDDIEEIGDWDIRLVDEGAWHDHLSTMAGGFGMPLDLLEAVCPAALVRSPDYAGFNAHQNDAVVSTSALIVSDGVAGVYNVATPEAYRGRGFGGATTRAAVAEGAASGLPIHHLAVVRDGPPAVRDDGCRTVVRWGNSART